VSGEADLEAQIRGACDAKDWDRAATLALEGYGSELLSFLFALLRSASEADDVYGTVCESLWRSLPSFRWDSAFRTYAYTVARHAFLKHRRDPRNRTPVAALSSPSAEAIAAHARTRTATYLRTETKDKVAELRAQLDPEDQTLLILRVNRQLAWRDIAKIMNDDADDAAVTRGAAALRKRFERLKEDLRAKLAAADA
jgi:RNA polymerase sigma-70 factor (ECF subfamily)